MRKFVIGLSALFAAGSANAAVVVSFAQGASNLPAGFTVFQNFSSYADGQLLPGATNVRAYADSVGGVAARPAFNSTGAFAAAATGGSYQVDFAPTRAFSFVLGSLDSYNALTLLYDNGKEQTFNGAQIALGGDADGNQSQPDSNGRVFYTAQMGDPSIVGARFASSGVAFEFDDLARQVQNPVPEPSTWGMMILGFGLIGGAMRRRKLRSGAVFG